ncbi:MAG: hypothetical protein VB053_06725 [Oscillibacter ruminantium]|uniref:hypothetical protein n=1 Tax=Oscillibacter ruminantium TaxID=1263547 RepID=UPI002B20064B|nr:hypothetical protein [Oscillibacter ruminantium]MEA5042223.1 hypothetical protein [Oscillibacter ruminantium]
MFFPIWQNRTDLVGWTLTENDKDSVYHTIAIVLSAEHDGVTAMIDPDSMLAKMDGAYRLD